MIPLRIEGTVSFLLLMENPPPLSEGNMAITNAMHLYQDYEVRIYMVGFGSDVAGSAIIDDIAEAGGCSLKSDGHYAYYANNAEELRASLREIIYKESEG